MAHRMDRDHRLSADRRLPRFPLLISNADESTVLLGILRVEHSADHRLDRHSS